MRVLASRTFARLNPVRSASYSVSLLVVGNCNLTSYFRISHSVIWGPHLLLWPSWWRTHLFGPSMSSFRAFLLYEDKWILQWSRQGPGLWLLPTADILCRTGQARWPIGRGILLHLSCSSSFLLVGLSWRWWDVPGSSGAVIWKQLLGQKIFSNLG